MYDAGKRGISAFILQLARLKGYHGMGGGPKARIISLTSCSHGDVKRMTEFSLKVCFDEDISGKTYSL